MNWTNIDLLRHRSTVLTNGGTLPLSEAIEWFDRLALAQDADDLEWDPLYHLRAAAIGQPLDPAATRTFAQARLLNPDGTLDPGFRDVILSAVRGQDRALHLESPFTDQLDRALAEFARAREVITAAADLGQLDPDLVKAFLAPSRFDRALEGLTRLHEDASRAAGEPPDPSIPPPSYDAKTFAERVLRKAFPHDDPDKQSPPSPPSP
jgi:hypothetical protein